MIGDLYHRWVYRFLACLTAWISDSTRYAFSDLMLGASLYLYELVFLSIALCIWLPPKPGEWASCLIVLAVVMMTYGFNFLRTPLATKMSIRVPENIDKDAEIRYVIRRLNELSSSKELSFDEKNDLINASLDEFTRMVDGYQIAHAKRTKLSIFSRQLLRRRIGGVTCPFFQEIVVTSEMFPEDMAHEKAHLVGYAREHDAQFVGYVTMLRSEDPLKYMAYVHRLELLTRMFDVSLDELEGMGLNQRTIMELRRRKSFLDGELEKNSAYRKLLIGLGKVIRSAMLWVFGEGGCKKAYVNTPMLMISAYDPPVTASCGTA